MSQKDKEMLCSYVNIMLLLSSLQNMNIKSQSGTDNCCHCYVLGTALQVLMDVILQQSYEIGTAIIPTFQRRKLRRESRVIWLRLRFAEFLTSVSDLIDWTTLLCDSPTECCSVHIIREMWKVQMWGDLV